jgi:hypothetical protein
MKDKLNCMFVNARSVLSNFKIEELTAYTKQNDLDVIGIAETWLTDNILQPEVSLNGYTLYRKDRCTVKQGRGGGVMLYVRNSVKSVAYHELNKLSTESVWCEVFDCKGNSIIVGVVYKSTSAETGEINTLLSLLKSLSCKHVLIMGDFNYPKINWSTFESDNTGAAFLEVIFHNFWTQQWPACVIANTRG